MTESFEQPTLDAELDQNKWERGVGKHFHFVVACVVASHDFSGGKHVISSAAETDSSFSRHDQSFFF